MFIFIIIVTIIIIIIINKIFFPHFVPFLIENERTTRSGSEHVGTDGELHNFSTVLLEVIGINFSCQCQRIIHRTGDKKKQTYQLEGVFSI